MLRVIQCVGSVVYAPAMPSPPTSAAMDEVQTNMRMGKSSVFCSCVGRPKVRRMHVTQTHIHASMAATHLVQPPGALALAAAHVLEGLVRALVQHLVDGDARHVEDGLDGRVDLLRF